MRMSDMIEEFIKELGVHIPSSYFKYILGST